MTVLFFTFSFASCSAATFFSNSAIFVCEEVLEITYIQKFQRVFYTLLPAVEKVAVGSPSFSVESYLVSHWFSSYYSLIGLENLRHSLRQSDTKLKPNRALVTLVFS